MVSTAAVEISPTDLVQWNAMCFAVAWMREVPCASDKVAIFVCVAAVVANWPQTLAIASFLNVGAVHHALHGHPLEIPALPLEALRFASIPSTYSLSIHVG